MRNISHAHHYKETIMEAQVKNTEYRKETGAVSSWKLELQKSILINISKLEWRHNMIENSQKSLVLQIKYHPWKEKKGFMIVNKEISQGLGTMKKLLLD